nr:diphosphate--fructose-6-phosphate 1-phosphotransferase [Prevotella sp.]
MKKSVLQKERASFRPKLPKALQGQVKVKECEPTQSIANREEIKKLFPHTYGMPLIEFEPGEEERNVKINVGVILSGGQAPGGHNVICGLYDQLKKLDSDNRLYGFLMGPSGLVEHKYIEITDDHISDYLNTGGFDMLGSGRTKLETIEQFEKVKEIADKLNLKAIVIIGGDDSGTNSCMLAEYYLEKKYDIQVIGCPKTIDGDLRDDQIEISFGFDTATKTYSELIGNIERDSNSARKYWHFIKLMGRSASHIALECALQTHPNICLISEEVREKDMTLKQLATSIATAVAKRSAQGNNFGVVLIPEGLIEFVPALNRLIAELNDLMVEHIGEYKNLTTKEQKQYMAERLSQENAEMFDALPDRVARQLSMERDPHGNVQVSLIATDILLSHMVRAILDKWKLDGRYKGTFATQHHFLGYEGRCAFPTNFDVNYCYSLGASAAHLIANGKTGYMTFVKNLTAPVDEWTAGGEPFTKMLNMEKRNGEMTPVIRKSLVDLNGAAFKAWEGMRDRLAIETDYIYPGPIQYFGPDEVCNQPTLTLSLDSNKK